MSKKLAIFGSGGHGVVAADIAMQIGYEVIFFDDRYPNLKKTQLWDVKGKFIDLLEKRSLYTEAFVAIGENQTRRKKFISLKESNFNLPNLKHPSSVISQSSVLGEGILVAANVVINPFVSISNGAIINTGSIIEHDCFISDFTHIGPGTILGGNVKVLNETLVGLGTRVKPNIFIGSQCVIGAGSIVVKDVKSHVLAYGVPAEVIKEINYE